MRLVLLVSAVGACGLPARPPTPKVTPLAAPQCAPAPAATRTVSANPTTIAAALASAQPGDRIELADGRYSDSIDVAADGTADAPIVLVPADGASVTIGATMTIHGRGYVELRGLSFDSPDSQAWLLVDGAAHDLTLVGNAFDSHGENRDDGAFTGVALTGSHHVVCGNAFGSWLGDEVWIDAVDGLAVINNDWSQASGEHSLLTVTGRHVEIAGNAFRNPWQRALHITDRSDTDRSEDMVVERNTFIDSDWITGAGNPSGDDDSRGGNEVVRFLGARGIFRNNLLVGNHEGSNWPCHGILNFQTFSSSSGIDTRRFAQFRVYGNTFDNNRTTAIIFYVGVSPIDLSDNKFANNVVAGSEHYAFSMCGGTGIPWQTYRVDANVIPGSAIHLDLAATTGITVDDAATTAPDVFASNLDVAPEYVDPSFGPGVAADPTSYTLDQLPAALAAYRLAPASAGAGKAAPLAHVVAAASAQTSLVVDDVLWFSDGMTMVAGDTIRVGATTAVVLARDVASNTLTLDRPVTASAGDVVELADSTGDPGVH